MSKKGLRIAKRAIRKQYRPIKKAARKAARKEKRMERLEKMAKNRKNNSSMPGPAPIENTVNYNAIGDALNM